MKTPLTVRHMVSYKDEPLVVVDNFPGGQYEASPARVRALAIALLKAADDCELLAKDARRYGPIRREYSVLEGSHS